ncbi:hypothetical protein VNO78_12438 [Psophocarpus tetragonolobus]|uniref:Uncharacterized protein n=1 Tax=Psophocarpus tetragonolobus TaxID=3891 RepID=A0AAN9XPV3_PSOTE
MLENPFANLGEVTSSARGGAMLDEAAVCASGAFRVMGKSRGTLGRQRVMLSDSEEEIISKGRIAKGPEGQVHLVEDIWCITFIKSEWPTSITVTSRPMPYLCGMWN